MCPAHARQIGDAGARSSCARGFTLLELMIVVAVLALLVALSWPALRRHVMRSVVQEAAAQLVRDLSRARMAAIDYGQVMALRYEPGGSRYEVLAAERLDREDELRSPSVLADLPDESSGVETAESDRPAAGFQAQLDQDVVFADAADQDEIAELPAGSTLREMLEDEQTETEEVEPLIEQTSESDQAFSPPLFFYPTGRTDNAEFVLQGPDGYRVTVRVRGLTGAASIGPLEYPRREGTDEPEQERDQKDSEELFVEPVAPDEPEQPEEGDL